MPTARELLEQADALMRRNRKRGKSRFGDVPTLTDALGIERDASLAPTMILPQTRATDPAMRGELTGAESTATGATPMDADPISLDTLADVPVLTDAVLDWPPDARSQEHGAIEESAPDDRSDNAFPASAAEAVAAAATLQPPAVLEQEPREPAPAPDGDGDDAPAPALTASRLDDDFILEIPPSEEAPSLPSAADSPIASIAVPPTLAPSGREWDALAEEIRMQVLQHLDLFTDTGVRDQLGARLSPIVARASAALVETINRELGELVRGYVAEAIEREIDTWRNRSS